jgi:catechol 2,3-dioxygenase-like lactoylglutathione lyase family enzyme
MTVQLNHTIVAAKDKEASARFLVDMFGLGEPVPYGPFLVVEADNGVSLDFMDWGDQEISHQHYAFLVSEDAFDGVYARILERELPYWADPHGEHPGEINHRDGGRGVYFSDPSGHWLEALTVPYGGWPAGPGPSSV